MKGRECGVFGRGVLVNAFRAGKALTPFRPLVHSTRREAEEGKRGTSNRVAWGQVEQEQEEKEEKKRRRIDDGNGSEGQWITASSFKKGVLQTRSWCSSLAHHGMLLLLLLLCFIYHQVSSLSLSLSLF